MQRLWKHGAVLVLVLLVAVGASAAPEAWPGGEESERVDITQADMGGNMSGLFWNSLTRKLWLVSNSGVLWRMSCPENCQTASNWQVESQNEQPCKWTIGGDTEAITQSLLDQDLIFAGVEQANGTNQRLIRSYDLSQGAGVAAVLTNEWNLSEMQLGANNEGLESLAFVPDVWLMQAGFTTQSGALYQGSAYQTGGLFLAGLQGSGADIYAFDLDLNHPGAYTFVGQYDIGQTELAELWFDRSDGLLYSYHNYGSSAGSGSPDILQQLGLTPEGSDPVKTFAVLRSWTGPRIHNNEGMAIVANDECLNAAERYVFLATDDAGIGNSVGIYPRFPTTQVSDEDQDGVVACEDHCPGTQEGLPVDELGCALPPTVTPTVTPTPTATVQPTMIPPDPTATAVPTSTPTDAPPPSGFEEYRPPKPHLKLISGRIRIKMRASGWEGARYLVTFTRLNPGSSKRELDLQTNQCTVKRGKYRRYCAAYRLAIGSIVSRSSRRACVS